MKKLFFSVNPKTLKHCLSLLLFIGLLAVPWSAKGQCNFVNKFIAGEVDYENSGLGVRGIKVTLVTPTSISAPKGVSCNSVPTSLCSSTSDMYGGYGCTVAIGNTPAYTPTTVNILPETGYDYCDFVLGISTYDAVLVNKHYLGITLLPKPWKFVAGDVDGNQVINVADKNYITQLILGVISSFPNDPWKFAMGSNTSLPAFNINPYPYLFSGSTFSRTGVTLTNYTYGYNWVIRGTKIGDVNGSSCLIYNNNCVDCSGRLPSGLVNTHENAASLDLVWKADANSSTVQSGEEFTLQVGANNFKDVLGYQFGMFLDPTFVEVLQMTGTDLPDVSEDNFNYQSSTGELKTLYVEPTSKGVSLDAKKSMFQLRCRALRSIKDLSSVVRLDDNILKREFYGTDDNLLPIQPVVSVINKSIPTLGLVCNPNPFGSNVNILLQMPQDIEPEIATVEFVDLLGRTLLTAQQTIQTGFNQLNFATESLPDGVMLVVVRTTKGIYTQKIIKNAN